MEGQRESRVSSFIETRLLSIGCSQLNCVKVRVYANENCPLDVGVIKGCCQYQAIPSSLKPARFEERERVKVNEKR